MSAAEVVVLLRLLQLCAEMDGVVLAADEEHKDVAEPEELVDPGGGGVDVATSRPSPASIFFARLDNFFLPQGVALAPGSCI